MHDADDRGFPTIQMKTKIWGRSYDAGVYAGLWQFHQGKGFDPDSVEVARHLGDPLLRFFPALDIVVSDHADEPSRSWNIIISVQFALLITLGIFWVCEYFHEHYH
ncbi:hypothetical protein B0H13DRAFT_1946604, partial [Mycena leptocephala]